ncbi:MAG: sulfatase-like hydrolase/transferase, partial [Lentisphaeraceae bacterium]|nr:sulfatase-like hydrolase/transferase [Lentisphaeraceae bacterium]
MALIALQCSAMAVRKSALQGKRPNIILVMADDQGWGDTGYNGHPFVQTPELDKMARAGLRFDRFYAGAPVCSPTRGSVLTGRHPMRIKILNHGHYMRPQEETIAEALKRGGYATGHFGKWHIGSVQKQSPVCPGNSGFDEWITAPNCFDIDPYLSDNGIAKRFKGESSSLVVDWAI